MYSIAMLYYIQRSIVYMLFVQMQCVCRLVETAPCGVIVDCGSAGLVVG